MGTYAIQLDDKVLEQKIGEILNEVLTHDLKNRYGDSGRVMSEGIRELIYSRKDEIIDMVVDKAAKEIARKALPRLLERMEDNG